MFARGRRVSEITNEVMKNITREQDVSSDVRQEGEKERVGVGGGEEEVNTSSFW